MYSHTAPQAAPHAQEIKLSGQLGQPFLAKHDGLIKEARRAILPFSFQISPTREGVQITGDEVAVMLAARILEQMEETLPEIGTPDELTLKAAVSTVVETTLRRDLTFRLKGLRHAVQPMSLSQVAFMQTLLSKGGQ